MAGRIEVFLSYRRTDRYQARAVSERLDPRQFNVFRDIEDIALGQDFGAAIHDRLANTDVVLALIGPGWKAEIGRLSDHSDWVRQEIESAITADVHLVPVLMDVPTMPLRAELPDSAHGLLARHAIQIREDGLDRDVRALSEQLVDLVDRVGSRRGSSVGRDAFAFCGRLHTDPVELAYAMSQEWSAARDLVGGVGSGQNSQSEILLDWLRAHRLDDAVLALRSTTNVERALVSLLITLNPEMPPVFAGHSVALADLSTLVRWIGDNSWEHGWVIMSLLSSGALSLYSKVPGQHPLALVDERWQRSAEQAKRTLGGLPGDVHDRVDGSLVTSIYAFLLLAVVEGWTARPVAGHLFEVVWFNTAANQLASTEPFVQDIVLGALAPIAADTHARQERERLQHVEQERRQQEQRAHARRMNRVYDTLDFLRPSAGSLIALVLALLLAPLGLILAIRSLVVNGANLWAILALLVGLLLSLALVLNFLPRS